MLTTLSSSINALPQSKLIPVDLDHAPQEIKDNYINLKKDIDHNTLKFKFDDFTFLENECIAVNYFNKLKRYYGISIYNPKDQRWSESFRISESEYPYPKLINNHF